MIWNYSLILMVLMYLHDAILYNASESLAPVAIKDPFVYLVRYVQH